VSTKAVREQLRDYVPWWLQDRKYSSGKVVGFTFLWVLAAVLDAMAEWLLQSLRAAWPGKGTPTALPYIGRSRGILRGQADTDDAYAARLRMWLDKWRDAGTQRQLAIELHEYLGNAPRVRIVNRAGHMVTVAADGTITEATCAWDWDSVTNPERATWWSELWVIVYPTQWATTGTYGDGRDWGPDPARGFGHAVTREEVDAVKAILGAWKAAHSKVRAVIWTSDAALFNPAAPATLPNGRWGQWSIAGAPSDRNVSTCRYWEP
jgi:hypothetical protein